MNITYVFVSSIDGRTDPDIFGDQHVGWASKEDQEQFFKIIDKAQLLIMGSSTYEHAKHLMQHREGRKRIVMTGDTSKYENEKIEGQLEFTNESPVSLITRLESEGYTEGYHLGGANCASSFFKEKLITHIILTIEPILFGKGIGIADAQNFNISLQLESVNQLNHQGTLLLNYSVQN